MILRPSAHPGELTVEGILELFKLGGQFTVDVPDLSLEIEPEDEVDVLLQLQTYLGMPTLYP